MPRTISENEFKRLMKIELENELLRSENKFLFSKIHQYKIKLGKEENERMKFHESQHLGYTNLSVRALNCLKAADITTVQELIVFCQQHGREKLLGLRNFGKKAYNEVIEFMNSNNITV